MRIVPLKVTEKSFFLGLKGVRTLQNNDKLIVCYLQVHL